MKYDSGMTQFHNDIIAALRHMLKNNSEITEKFSPNDGSPAPLRDYLKQKYGKSYTSHIGDGMRYSCKTATGVELAHGAILNNTDDKKLTLSWSQTAKFIRDNWNEIFKKSESAGNELSENKTTENQLSYIDKLRERYPKVNETDDWFNCYCPSDLFVGAGVPAVSECPLDPATGYAQEIECTDCWKLLYPIDVNFHDDLKDFEKSYFEHYPEEDTAETDTVPEISEEKFEVDKLTENQVVPQNAEEISEQFNYAVLSAEIGDYLKRKEQQLKNEYMNFTANCGAIFAEAQEKLAGSNQYNGLFEKWITSIGFSKPTVYRMIEVHKFRSSQIETSNNTELFDRLSKSLQYEIAKPSAPAELVEQVLCGDITTHKDYIALKKQLEDANKRTKDAEFHKNTVNESYKRLEATNHRHYTNLIAEQKKNSELENRIKELENRPVDVAVQRDDTALAEIGRLKDELAKAQQEILNASFGSTSDNSGLVSELYETLHSNALSAIRSCADFAEKNSGKFTSRFRSLAEAINDYINEMEEF